jgi:hypothetical protein
VELARKLFENKRLQGSPEPFIGQFSQGFFVSFLSAKKPGQIHGHIELAKPDPECAHSASRIP